VFGPIIRGEQVTLRPPRAEDLGTFIAWLADTELTRMLARTNPLSIGQEERWLEGTAESESTVFWALETAEPDSPRLIGTTVIHEIDWRNRHGVTGVLIGDRRCWGRGSPPRSCG
jgi:RimJ/RimL family protein N-acetyltransferase